MTTCSISDIHLALHALSLFSVRQGALVRRLYYLIPRQVLDLRQQGQSLRVPIQTRHLRLRHFHSGHFRLHGLESDIFSPGRLCDLSEKM